MTDPLLLFNANVADHNDAAFGTDIFLASAKLA